MTETSIKTIKATIVFTDGVKVDIESRPGADPAKAVQKIREILDAAKTTADGRHAARPRTEARGVAATTSRE